MLQVSPTEVVANVIEGPDRTLATLINTSSTPTIAEVLIKAGQIGYDPLSAQLFHTKSGRLNIEIAGGVHRLLLLIEPPVHPQVLFVLGARKLESEKWDPQSRTLTFSVSAIGAPLQITLYSTSHIRKISDSEGQSVAFQWSSQTSLAQFDTTFEGMHQFIALV